MRKRFKAAETTVKFSGCMPAPTSTKCELERGHLDQLGDNRTTDALEDHRRLAAGQPLEFRDRIGMLRRVNDDVNAQLRARAMRAGTISLMPMSPAPKNLAHLPLRGR